MTMTMMIILRIIEGFIFKVPQIVEFVRRLFALMSRVEISFKVMYFFKYF